MVCWWIWQLVTRIQLFYIIFWTVFQNILALLVEGLVDFGESMFKLGNFHISSCLDLGISTWTRFPLAGDGNSLRVALADFHREWKVLPGKGMMGMVWCLPGKQELKGTKVKEWQAKYLKFGSYEKIRSWSITHLSHAMIGSDQQSQGSKATGVRSKIMIANEYQWLAHIIYNQLCCYHITIIVFIDFYYYITTINSDYNNVLSMIIIPLNSIVAGM